MQQLRFFCVSTLIAAVLLVTACNDTVSPRRDSGAPELATSPGGPIALDQQNGTMGTAPGGTTVLAKGFNPTNPHVGDAIVATFFWHGTTNIVTSVSDHLTDGTPVGNTYSLVEFVTTGTIAMATYAAVNAQNFPDPNLNGDGSCCDQNKVLVVQANLSTPVTEAGIAISAWTGVSGVAADALGAHRSASGSGSTTTTVSPGAVAVGDGALVYTVTMSDAMVGHSVPPGFTEIASASSGVAMKGVTAYAVEGSAATVDPQWTWFFSAPSSWLASVVALNPASTSPPPPAQATHVVFTTQPTSATAGSAISPAVQVAAEDSAGNTVTSFTGTITVALGANPGGGTLSGTTSAGAVNGVATFSNLSVNKVGTGYTLTASSTGLTGATSSAFNVTAGAVSASQSSVTASPTSITAGSGSSTITVTARDANGNPVSGATVALSATGSGNTLTQPAGPTNGSGVATGSLSSTTAETKTVSATAGGVAISQTATVTVTAAANQPPTADFTFSCSGLSCSFTSTSSDPDGSISAYSWTFGDGATSSAQNPSHSYAAGGSYTVTLRVTDNQGATSSPTSRTVSVTAPNQPPTANFTFGCSGLSCSFTSTSSDPDGSISAYSWTFGDGGTSTAQNPSHSYAVGGSYTVTLQVTDDQGAVSGTVSQTVTVTAPNSPPVVNAGSDETAILGVLYSTSFSFTDANNDGPWSYTIDWGDGNRTTGSRSSQGSFGASHTYVGLLTTYTVTVTVTDTHGASGSDTKKVTVLLL